MCVAIKTNKKYHDLDPWAKLVDCNAATKTFCETAEWNQDDPSHLTPCVPPWKITLDDFNVSADLPTKLSQHVHNQTMFQH